MPTPISQVAGISVPEARLIVIQPWDASVLKEIDSCLTTDAMITIIKENNMEEVFKVISQKASDRAWNYMREGKEDIKVEVYMLSMEGELLGIGRTNFH